MQESTFYIGSDSNALDIHKVADIVYNNKKISISQGVRLKVKKSFDYLQSKLNEKVSYYGINTGFGSLYNIKVEKKDIHQLQINLVLSHACGMGDRVPNDIVKIMILLKIQNLVAGHSGVSIELVERLVFFFNSDILPVIYTQGSLGASGDLAPLAHLSLPLLGQGEVLVEGEVLASEEVLNKYGLKPLELQAKEGLALLNGTQFSTAYACYVLVQARRLMYFANATAALSLDAYDSSISPFNELLHKLRPHWGQIHTAQAIRSWLEGSEQIAKGEKEVQDPYAFRCVPQVHGASWDAINYVTKVVETEINAVTDNPNVFPDEDMIISGGNFHAQPIALALDFLAIALAELASISERRTFNLISGKRALPKFLVANPGINSGMMIPQYTAASIVSQNKQLCTPASVDSIVSSNGQEDHVSMAANSATKLLLVAKNTHRVIAIEWMNAAQAMEFRELKTSPALVELIREYRKFVSPLENDRMLSVDMKRTSNFFSELDWNLYLP